MTSETESTSLQREQQPQPVDADRAAEARKGHVDSGDVGLTGLNQGEPIPEIELDADDQAQAREALELLDRLEAESGETLDRLIEISRRLNRSTAYALRQTNGVRNNRFRDLRTAWLRATGCLKHRLLKDKTTRSILLKFATEEHEPGLRAFWATLSSHERMKLHHPVSIWNRNVEYQNALAGIAKYKVQVQAYYEGLDEDDRTYIVVEFMPDTDEDAEDRRARLLVEPAPEDEDEPEDDADEEPKCLTPTFDQMCQRPVKLWSDFCKHIDAEMSYGGMGSELNPWWASAKNRQPILEALEPDEQKREALKPSYLKFPDLGHLQYKHYTLPLWALLWDRACQEIAAQKDEMRAWMEGLTEADRKHHLRGFSFDELTAHDPILLWQKFFARDRLYHYEDDEDDPPFRFDEETGGEEESGGGEEESGEEETGETGETGAETEATKEEPVAAERPKAEQLAAALEGIAGEEDAVEAWWVGQQERARTQQTVYIAAASLGGLLHLPFDEVRQREPVALWSDYSRRPEQPEQPEPDDPDDELFNEQPEPEDETEQPTAAEREQIKQDLIGVIATLIYDRRVDLTYADMRAVISAISTQVDVWRVLFADDPNEPDDDEPDPEPPTPPKPKPGGGDGGAGVDGDVRARHTVQANEQGNAQPTKAEADVGKNARAPSGENEAGVVPATESTTPLTERERQWQAKLVAMLRKIQDSPDGLAKSYIPKGILTALEKDRLIRAWGQRWNITYHGREWLDQRLTEDEYRALRAIQDNSAADNPVSVFVMSRGLQQRGLIEGNLRDHHLTELGQKRLAEYSTYAPAAKTESASS